MEIRKLSIGNYEEVYALWLSTPGMGLNDIDDSKDGIARYLARNPNTCFVALDRDKIIGAILSGHDGRRGYIYHTVVAQSEQNKGVGTALVDAALTALRGEGIHKVALVVFGRNATGNAFWEGRGFGTREDLVYRNRALTQMKRIDT